LLLRRKENFSLNGKEKNKKGNKKMIDQEIFEELSESLNGNYALEAKVLAAIMPTGW
jgi:hypothetical protein